MKKLKGKNIICDISLVFTVFLTSKRFFTNCSNHYNKKNAHNFHHNYELIYYKKFNQK